MEDHFSSQNISSTLDMFCFGEDPFFLSNKMCPFDISNQHYQWEFPTEGCVMEAMPIMDDLLWDPIHASLDIISTQGLEDEFNQYDSSKQIVVYDKEVTSSNGDDGRREQKKVNSMKCISSSNSSELTRAMISSYFYMPITQAARELNVGVTLLKKRCRELGIPRWPNRKLMSLKSLIKNVQEMESEDDEQGNVKIRNDVKRLQEQLKRIEEMPELELEDETKKLRQACFKANYKKRKHMKMLEWPDRSTRCHLSLENPESSVPANPKNVRVKIEEL